VREKAGRPDLQMMVGNLAVRRLLRSTTGRLIQRQPNPNVRPATAAERREFIEDTISYFNRSAQYFADRLVRLDQARFDRVVNGLHTTIIQQERIIDADLARDAPLKARLRAAYIAAIRAVMTRAAASLGKSEDDLYRENTGRIPMWAWRTPHHTERGITTPIAEGRTVDRRGNVAFASHGVAITIAPDRTVRGLRSSARTNIDFQCGRVSFSFQRSGRRLITRVNVGRPTARIQTLYRRGSRPESPSGYGRGTTREDIAGGRVNPRSTTLGFHEGMHGLSYIEFLEHNPTPQFNGAVGMTKADFNAELARYRTACRRYFNDLKAFSTRHVDCVGTTIDQFNQANARPGARIVLECRP
jgi:hypothetical protein